MHVKHLNFQNARLRSRGVTSVLGGGGAHDVLPRGLRKFLATALATTLSRIHRWVPTQRARWWGWTAAWCRTRRCPGAGSERRSSCGACKPAVRRTFPSTVSAASKSTLSVHLLNTKYEYKAIVYYYFIYIGQLLSHSDNHRSRNQDRNHSMNTDPGPQNTFSVVCFQNFVNLCIW